MGVTILSSPVENLVVDVVESHAVAPGFAAEALVFLQLNRTLTALPL